MAQLAECLLVWHSMLEALSVAPTGTCAWWSTPVGSEGQSHHPYSVGIHDWSGLDCVKRSMAPGRRGFIAQHCIICLDLVSICEEKVGRKERRREDKNTGTT